MSGLNLRQVFAKYRKAVGAVAVTVAAYVVSLATDGITAQEGVLIAGVGVSAVSVAIVPNLDAGIAKVAKTIIAFLLAGLTVAAAVIVGGLTGAEWVEILVAAFAAVGVTAIPNDWPPAQHPLVTPVAGSSVR